MVFELLDKRLRELIEKRFKQPTLPQREAIPKVLEGKNLLLISATGSGKTEAALFPILHFILKKQPKEISALYITPLRSLNRDLLDRIVWWCNRLGVEVSVRHGDTSSYQRRQQVHFPPQLLILTAETLQPILVGKKLKELLKNVRWVIIDEVHELVSSKRGIQLALGLERLRSLCKKFQIIMLSATIGNPEDVARFFSLEEVEVVKADVEKEMEINVITPKLLPKDRKIAQDLLIPLESASRLRKVVELIKTSRSCLVFTNTREFAEILASRVKRLEKLPIEVHHSSLSREVRTKVEKDFKDEKIKAIICTSSLQLGIDIGSVDLVVQYQSPRQVSQLIQRVGRSGHWLEKTSKGVLIAGDDDDAFESSVIARKALNQEIEIPKIFKNSLDVLSHQIIGLLFEFRRSKPKEIFSIVSRCYPYRTLSYEEFLSVCKFLEAIGLIFFDDELKLRRRSFEHYFSQLSTIPSAKQFKIINSLTNKIIGTLDEEFVSLHGEIGTSFIVKGEVWKIVDIDEDKVLVEPSKDMEAAIPVWTGELIPVPFEVAQEVGRLREFIALNIHRREFVRSKLLKSYPIDERTAQKMINTIEQQLKEGVVPTHKLILVEEEGDVCVFHSCLGSKVNETLGRVLSALLASKIGTRVNMKSDPYRIIFRSSFKKAERIKEILKSLRPEFLESYLDLLLPNTNLFEWKFLHVAKRFGVLAKDAEYSKLKVRKLIEEFRGTPVFKETLNEIKTEKLEIELTKKVLEKIQKGEIEVKVKEGLSFLGRVGLERYFGDIILPKKVEKEILSIFKRRLLETKMLFVCLNCGRWSQTFAIKDLPEDLKCKLCGARLIAPLKTRNPEILKFVRKALRKDLKPGEGKKFRRMEKKANLFLTYGKKVALVMAARGVGSETAKRILSRFYKDESELLKQILETERKYLLTKKFWRL